MVPALDGARKHFSIGVFLAPPKKPLRLGLHGLITLGLTTQQFGLERGHHHPVRREGVGDVRVALHVHAAPFGPQREHLIVEVSDGKNAQHDGQEDGQQTKVGCRDAGNGVVEAHSVAA